MELEILLEKLDFIEDYDLEFKASEDNLPKDIWKTISAFTNTNGGYIILGITEKRGSFLLLESIPQFHRKKTFGIIIIILKS